MSDKNLHPAPGAIKKRSRVGRGPGSGNGKTAGRGHKGQKARSGGSIQPWFEGGQMPLQRRIPKRGFKNFNRIEFQVVNVGKLAEYYSENEEVTIESLFEKGIVKRDLPVKILGKGDINIPLTVKAHAFSKTAREKIEGSGGKTEEV
ncbi:MAG TPA: 50S ribosomal protein L15 [Firmicutes bacterium]|uniref:Large ribosomal subunit protein uL15 n=1 Tax=candidate division TA06 bacterium TaxID=2250710 RepID=A0A660S729_UNCT6|nr:50S ribosomal protein L15 [candidate division WOR-3 bacterium]RKX64697.1 MAG: 50S ribosomal protein L15 [candidate division TA06 bacterium]HFD05198.1 50S ribosomal protein L15 [Bacillota bacterium]